jgi:hypothetical protein
MPTRRDAEDDIAAVPSPALSPQGGQVALRTTRKTLIAVALTLLAALILVVVALELHSVQRQRENDKEYRTGLALRNVSVLVNFWAADHGGEYPPADLVTKTGLSQKDWQRVGWPDNPFTGQPMKTGRGPGDFEYRLGKYVGSYTLVAYGRGGRVVATFDAD